MHWSSKWFATFEVFFGFLGQVFLRVKVGENMRKLIRTKKNKNSEIPGVESEKLKTFIIFIMTSLKTH